ncbi:MAG: methyltransferase domain-containing protein [Sphingomonas sp.]|nr:methyltransferase domain-containing protein [Sphingomonas sp.]MDX3885888.1 methyltransferase domain-containing protein [Sphingomonas sp.]
MNAHVAHAFGQARDYDAAARVQAHAARRLAERIGALSLPRRPRVLEIGCGTGLLSETLIRRIGLGDWLLTDIAPAMLDRCAERIGPRLDVGFALVDGERPDVEGDFDLICSSFAFQWFADLPGAIGRLKALLRPGGRLAFATMAAGSLAEWDAAHRAATGEAPAMGDYPAPEALTALGATVESEYFVDRHADARAFLAGLRAIGAHRPRVPRPPVPAPALRRAMAAFEAEGAGATYHIAYGTLNA